MPRYTQANRPMAVNTPLGTDALLLTGFTGQEAISQLFNFQLDLLAENSQDVAFDRLLGQKAVVRLSLPGNKHRYFSGICSRISQGLRDHTFTHYRMEVVPQFWLLTRRAQSRIFQHISVPDILKRVLAGLDVAYEIQGTFQPRDYCVQYRETDFNFASRLMEEEGIFYFFKHTDDGHKMVLANTPQSHQELPEGSNINFDPVQGGGRVEGEVEEERIYEWLKIQELRSGKYTLWDHCFELPHKHLEAERPILDSVPVGEVTHKLKVGGNDKLEIYDFPGEYAQRFDGIDRGGGEQPAELQKIFQDNKRTTEIRMQQETVPGIVLRGASNCRNFVSGFKFTLKRHFNADGKYLLVSVKHSARLNADYRSGDDSSFLYENAFTCIPLALPFRPARLTEKPVVQGTQTAVVVGPHGEEIFTDKYGRVKVQFHWDREGKNDADSSCWVRVGQFWAGKRWGASFWPRIGQEVIVDYLEGDPDQPIIVGSVYNADQMPPYLGKGPDGKHPNDNKVSGVKSNTTKGGQGYNEWRFDDTKGKEQIFIHGERNIDTRIKNDCMENIGHNRHLTVGGEKDGQKYGDQRERVYRDKDLIVGRHHQELIQGNMLLYIGGEAGGGNQDINIVAKKTETIGDEYHLHVKKHFMHKVNEDYELIAKNRFTMTEDSDQLHVKSQRAVKVDQSDSLTVGTNKDDKIGQKYAAEAGQEIHLKAGMKVVIEAGTQLTLKGPGGFVDIGPSGVTIQGTMVLINSGGAAGSGSGSSPTAPNDPDPPDDAKEAKPTKPDQADDSKTGYKSCPS